MINDHNLDDLIIDTPERKGGKAKSFLTIIALFIVVLIAGIILTKIILKDPDNQRALLEDNDTVLVSPELTLQDAVDDKEDEEALSEMIKSEMEPPKEPSSKTEAEEVATETVVIEESKPEKKAEETTVSQAPAAAVKPSQSKPSTPAAETKPEKKEVVHIPQSRPMTKPVTASKPNPAPVQATQEQYYIQVGSFSKKPNSSRLTSALKKQGFRYQTMKINGMYKIMVGPYPSRPAADRAIIRVKDLINKQAFVVKK